MLSHSFRPARTTRDGETLRQIFSYDEHGRLLTECATTPGNDACNGSEATTTYEYDPVGNRLTRTAPDAQTAYSHDAADQLTQTVTGTDTVTYTYDADGNQTAAGPDTFTYDAAGRLTDVNAGDKTVTYTYDADGNRTTAAVDGKHERTTWWDIVNPLPQIATEYDGSGTLIGNHTYDPLGRIQTRNTSASRVVGPGIQYYHHDAQGSVTDVTDDTGANQYGYNYTAFGVTNETALVDDAPPNPFTYTGQYNEPTTQAAGQNLRARNYNPDLGRFISQDPAPRPAGQPYTTAYAYAENLPTSQSDPSGRCPMCISAGIGGVLGGVIEGGIYAFTTDDFTWGGLAQAAGQGAVIGAAGGALMPGAGNAVARATSLTGGSRLALSTGVNAAVGAGYAWTVNTVLCRPTDPTDLLIGALGGAASGLVVTAGNGGRSSGLRYSFDALDEPTFGGIPSGSRVTYTATSTRIGDDAATVRNATNVAPTGRHDVIAHGTTDGFLDLAEGRVNGGQIVDAVRSNPNYNGCGLRLLVCHSGATSSRIGQQIADEMGVTVQAPTNRVGTNRYGGTGQTPVIAEGGYWRIYLPILGQ
ncbi:YD repeat protein [Streptomyces xiamenensis]|uniref:YD repeat protein n=1 Tax=Streptomyces xiamenensis TaxID=408015 RepID=A0A0F7FPZ3_9ACTN|nr:RHS repeat-associated core domain-containing protein [Streptomyces xiamenensis]AKG41407.1 YD repeat protein [Streptomyces xiamenensis]